MAFIDFTQKNMINIPEIDDQHRNLFAILNKMHAATSEGMEQSAIVEIFNDLIRYTVEHFETEEIQMKQYDYPKYAAHKKEHDDLTNQAIELQKLFYDGSATVTFELLDFLHQWLNDHTMGTDTEMGEFLCEQQ
ncbi:bacteriohemerythrin [Pseudodesulfovibrio sediminis]|uniref:Hemerythrin n=1 Tax=Pseudodesulfovibrio sediminis TaxID=2810563 RepID=A0ABN6ETQ5_9BACT|nr:bacteriohemerythrin [Pseudodesulfovibrio sediminis]BCS88615.1 hemerythrin [Pseudodesulfovibrio sediminis]